MADVKLTFKVPGVRILAPLPPESRSSRCWRKTFEESKHTCSVLQEDCYVSRKKRLCVMHHEEDEDPAIEVGIMLETR